jgi:hypothetical protein
MNCHPLKKLLTEGLAHGQAGLSANLRTFGNFRVISSHVFSECNTLRNPTATKASTGYVVLLEPVQVLAMRLGALGRALPCTTSVLSKLSILCRALLLGGWKNLEFKNPDRHDYAPR